MMAWKRPVPERDIAGCSELQWGHADDGVEERCDEPRTRERRSCFNGATPMMAWKSTRIFQYLDRQSRELQWGHADDGVEERGWRCTPCRSLGQLQWGHADDGV